MIDLRIKHNPRKRTVSFRFVILKDSGDEVIYQGKGTYGNVEPSWELSVNTEPVEIPWTDSFRHFVPGLTHFDLTTEMRRLQIDPSKPITRTVKPKRVPADG